MTQIDEPNLDEQIRNIIGQIPNYVLEYLEISDGIKQDWADHQRAYLQLYSDKVKALIANQVREAKIQELEYMQQHKEDVRLGSKSWEWVADRIAQLRSTSNEILSLQFKA